MDTDQEQEQFRALFSELKRADESEAPSFDRTLAAATAGGRNPRSFAPGARLAAAVFLAATGVAAAVLVGHFYPGSSHSGTSITTIVSQKMPPVAPQQISLHAPGQPIVLAADPSILEWQSPTAFLLDLSADPSPPSGAATEPADGAVHENADHRHL